MASIIDIAQNETCDVLGGAVKAYATSFSNITAVTVGSSGEISGFTMTGTGQWGKLEFDDESNTAFYNETGEQVGNQVRVNGEGLMRFVGLSQSKIEAANNAKDCCGLVIVWFLNSGLRRVQGVDVAPDQSWNFSKRKPRIVPTLNSDTADNEEYMEYNVPHQGKYFGATTSLDDTAIEAL